MEIRYAIYFGDVGYYADKQPHYEWSFTQDLNEAKLYKSFRNADKQMNQGQHWSNSVSGNISYFDDVKKNCDKIKINWDKSCIVEVEYEKIITIKFKSNNPKKYNNNRI